jgi:hypothetical protein
MSTNGWEHFSVRDLEELLQILDAAKFEALRGQIAEALDLKKTAREWIIQRCTQYWKGSALIYEDWPFFLDRGLPRLGFTRLMTRDEMKSALEYCKASWPEDEFRGHVVSDRCLPMGCNHHVDAL